MRLPSALAARILAALERMSAVVRSVLPTCCQLMIAAKGTRTSVFASVSAVLSSSGLTSKDLVYAEVWEEERHDRAE